MKTELGCLLYYLVHTKNKLSEIHRAYFPVAGHPLCDDERETLQSLKSIKVGGTSC
jgi:hypothetical protein